MNIYEKAFSELSKEEMKELNELVQDSEKDEDELVQYYIVNSELNMSAGKIAAQVAHVATLITIDYLEEDIFEQWINMDQPKIILRGKQKEMDKLIEQGWHYIHDLGRTEIEDGSLTCIGFRPEWKSIMKPIVKRLQLL